MGKRLLRDMLALVFEVAVGYAGDIHDKRRDKRQDARGKKRQDTRRKRYYERNLLTHHKNPYVGYKRWG